MSDDQHNAGQPLEGRLIEALSSEVDWTRSADGRLNSSPEYLRLVDVVTELIRNSRYSIMDGGFASTAGLIMAQLAHQHGVAPVNLTVLKATEESNGVLKGTFLWGSRVYSLEATPMSSAITPDDLTPVDEADLVTTADDGSTVFAPYEQTK